MRRDLKHTLASTSSSNDVKQVDSLRATRKRTYTSQSSSADVPEASEASTLSSGYKIELALVKFFGGPPTCLAQKGKGNTKSQSSPSKIPGFNASSQSPIKWTDILADGVDVNQFRRQRSGVYRCYILGRVIEISAENYRFISLGLPQRMMRSSSSETQREHETAVFDNEGRIKSSNIILQGDTEWSDGFVPDLGDSIDSTDTSTGSDIPYEIVQYDKRASPAHQESQFRTGHRIYKPKQSEGQARQQRDPASEKLGSLATDQVDPKDIETEAGAVTEINDGSEASWEIFDETSGSNNKSESPIPTTPQKTDFIHWAPSPAKNPDSKICSAVPDTARNTSPRKAKRPLYSEREVFEGPAFIKALIQAGIPWEKQEELYASKFGVSRPQVGLLQRFNLTDMRLCNFEPAVFKNPVRKFRFQPSRYSSERGVHSTSNAASRTSSSDREKNMATTEDKNLKPSVSAKSDRQAD